MPTQKLQHGRLKNKQTIASLIIIKYYNLKYNEQLPSKTVGTFFLNYNFGMKYQRFLISEYVCQVVLRARIFLACVFR
jgi:hypothetical protein